MICRTVQKLNSRGLTVVIQHPAVGESQISLNQSLTGTICLDVLSFQAGRPQKWPLSNQSVASQFPNVSFPSWHTRFQLWVSLIRIKTLHANTLSCFRLNSIFAQAGSQTVNDFQLGP
jgi:hypothetical protein